MIEEFEFMSERIDDIGFGNLRLIQDTDGFCYGVDAVLLADFAATNKVPPQKEDVLAVDLGTGTGIIPLILSHKTVWKKIVGIEVQEGSFTRAVSTARLNGLEDRIEYYNIDVKDVNWKYEHLIGKAEVVTCNPPYVKRSGGLINTNNSKAIARHETTAELGDFIGCAKDLLKPGGHLFMVHRPSRLVDICFLGRKIGMEPKEIRMVSPKKDQEPNILLVHMVKGGGTEMKILKEISVYDDEENYTEDILACYEGKEL